MFKNLLGETETKHGKSQDTWRKTWHSDFTSTGRLKVTSLIQVAWWELWRLNPPAFVEAVPLKQWRLCYFSYRLTLKAQCLLYVPSGLTITKPTPCPHRAFLGFVSFSEKRAIIYLHKHQVTDFCNRD